MSKRKNYIVEVFCKNCDYGVGSWPEDRSQMRIPIGTKVEEMICPKCGCKTIEAYRG